MQSVLSRIWIRIAVSISIDDNHYTTGTVTDDNAAGGDDAVAATDDRALADSFGDDNDLFVTVAKQKYFTR